MIKAGDQQQQETTIAHWSRDQGERTRNMGPGRQEAVEGGPPLGSYSGRNATSLRDVILKWEGRREKYAKLFSMPPPLLPPISQTQVKAGQKGLPTLGVSLLGPRP